MIDLSIQRGDELTDLFYLGNCDTGGLLFRFVILRIFYFLVLTLPFRVRPAYLFTFNLMIRYRGLVDGLYLFTIYALPLTKLNLAFGSDSHRRVPA
jgi:hypothetical protein